MADYITKSNFINKQKNEIICVKGLRNYIEHCIEKTRSMDGKCVNKNFTEMLKVYGEQTVCDFYTGLKKTYDDKNWQFHFYNNVTRAYENAEKNGWCY